MLIKITQIKIIQHNIINITIIQMNITKEHKWIILIAFQEEVIDKQILQNLSVGMASRLIH